VDGPTLAERLTSGSGLTLDEAVPIARQIAEALEAAHEKGIVHRDLKPANVKLDADGRVKVLDFGLAKALDTAGSSIDPMLSPTLTSPMTAAGMLLGTAAYMAPEQARGVAVDKRADVWAFGVVFFEMLTGRLLFAGDTVSDTVASVLRQEIDWTALPAGTPPAVVRLLGRCLERDPKKRLRDIGEARIALEQVGAAEDEPFRERTADRPRPVARRRRRVLWATAAGVSVGALALLAAGAALWRSRGATELPLARVSVSLPGDASFNLANRPVLAVSSDGATLALVVIENAVERLHLRPLAEFDPRPLAGTEGASNPAFSPDGSWIAFVAGGRLKKIPTDGGPVVSLAEVGDSRGITWDTNDTIVYQPQATGPLYRISAAGGRPEPITKIDEQKRERTHRWPFALPGGRTILFTVGSVEHPDDYDDATIEAVQIETGARRLVLDGGRMAGYAASGHLLFVRGRILYAVAFDAERLELSGAPVPVVDGVSGDTTTGAAHYSVSANGTLTYVPGDPSGALRRLQWMDLKGAPTPIDVPPALYCDPHVSPDGTRIAVSIIDNVSNRDIWVIDPARGTSSRLTFRGLNRTPAWSPDGATLYFVSYDATRNVSVTMMKASDGSGDARPVGEINGQAYIEDLTPDGATLLVSAQGTSSNIRSVAGVSAQSVIYRLPVAGDGAGKPQQAFTTPGDTYASDVSPDSRWLAYASNESGRSEVFVQSFQSSGGRAQVSTSGGIEPHWSPDGRAIYYQQNGQFVMVPVEPGPTFVAGRPRTLFGGLTGFPIDSGQTYGVARGDRLVMMRYADDRASKPEVRVTLNWFSDLRRTLSR
jgi:serine/threonine-protein kinase